jgi:hypothetical protein
MKLLIKFPTERINKEFVGDVFDENKHPKYYKFITIESLS